jgi:NAD(P)-dependent dehydrogenase (short-subunit alcohol dehydrogenase family)
MSDRLDGTSAVITGAGRGIGREIAGAFAAAGAEVALLARSENEIGEAADEINAGGGRAVAIRCDVTVAAEVSSAVADTVEAFGRINVLVNNAGGGCPPVAFAEMQEAWWDEHIARNLKSAFLCTRAVVPGMIERRRGSIINMSSVMGLGPHPLRTPYAAAKAGLIGLGATLAVELGQYGIRVNTIAPGFIETERMWKQFPNYEQTLRKARLGKVPLGRMGVTADIAQAAVFLASDAASYITGQVLRVDGGLVTTVFARSEASQEAWW